MSSYFYVSLCHHLLSCLTCFMYPSAFRVFAFCVLCCLLAPSTIITLLLILSLYLISSCGRLTIFCFMDAGNLLHFSFLSYNFIRMYRSSDRRCSVKKVFLEMLQNSQKNTCARVSSLPKLQVSAPQLY